ncbi:MAG: hypothetical protein ACREF3_11105 [Acetobacteraceae bacterium]
MTIDIDALSEAELVELNHRVVARLRMLAQMRAHVDMLTFRIGERVCFHSSGRGDVEGVVGRYNRKTVTVIARDGGVWNVSPGYLRRVVEGGAGGPNVVPLKGR